MTFPSFIDIYDDVLEPEVCKEIIRRFEEDTENHFDGVCGSPDGQLVEKLHQKACTELALSPLPHWADIDKIIYEAVVEGLSRTNEKYAGLQMIENNVQDEGYRIKRYKPTGQGRGTGKQEYFNIHVDCNGFAHSHRQLVLFMYLNTVEKGGETEFPTQGLKVQPVEGRMVTFPPFWTHAHIGRPPIDVTKYAVTSWVTFPRNSKGLDNFGRRK